MAIPETTLQGYLLEEALAWLVRNTGYRLLVHANQDDTELCMEHNGLCVKGRGTMHQVDVLGEFAFPPAFSLPIRLFLEAKFTSRRVELATVRNAHGVIHDINENFFPGPGQQLRKRFRYVYALFSAKGFSPEAEAYALAHQISLTDLSGASFEWLRMLIQTTARRLHSLQPDPRRQRFTFPVNWMRDQLRERLGTKPDVEYDRPQTGALQFASAAVSILDAFAAALLDRERTELLLGFPAAPFILPLAAGNVDEFLAYATNNQAHEVRLTRGRGPHAEWTVTPIDQDPNDLFGLSYRLTFNLPERLEAWIAEHDEYRTSRTRAVKSKLLSDIVIYRMEGDKLRTYQLQYHPTALRRG
jgi:hypothetical protein